jgi:hypothetical protein
MHCPKCGVMLVEESGQPKRCAPGDMWLSEKLAGALRECYVENVRSPRERPFPARVGGEWFCPGCGIKTTEESVGDVRCPQCKRSLAEFIHALVELHPHAGLAGGAARSKRVAVRSGGWVDWILSKWRGRRTTRCS